MHTSESGLTEDEIFTIGINNLREIAESINITESEGLLYFSGSGDFEASLLLVPELWSDWLSDYCPNGYVAAIPARDILVVADKKNPQGIDKLVSIVERIWPNGDHLLSKSLFHQRDKKWIPYSTA